ncbi:MAG: SGNH/GDSL hydrolase family protein, partial [Candidatus Hydrogenedentes bacterium]|nr:SGNH/GDSL hydrolase family protein [Candidatus Hydrogenedentota bacterium]
MTSCMTWLAAGSLISLVFAGAAEAGEAGGSDADIVARSLVSLGDTARLQAALAKARRGERVVVGVLGGSITQGAGASKEENRYGNRIAAWWRETFPKAQIEFVNAGIGATGSDIGAHRVRAHLLGRHPDFVVVEYAVNDPNAPASAETLEGVVRQILRESNSPAVMLLFMMNKEGGNAQEQHELIGRHYGLPMVSFRDALWPEIKAGRMAWTDVEADEVHPNDRGHGYAARFVTNVLAQTLASLPPDAKLAAPKPVPAPKISDVFEFAAMNDVKTLTPAHSSGWEAFDDAAFGPFFGRAWKTSVPG